MHEQLTLYRRMTGLIRSIPDFIIIGGMKCGTTSLYTYLLTHPSVISAFKKEVHFFDSPFNMTKGLAWYRSHFPCSFYKYYEKKIHHKNIISGEASPYYIFHPLAAKRVSERIPHVKLIAMLRNPVDRAYSHYHHNLRTKIETLSFADAIESESERLKGEREKLLLDESYYSVKYRRYSYLARGIYVDQLQSWMSLFSKEQVLILNADCFVDPQSMMNRVFDFLKIPRFELKLYPRQNKGTYTRMDPVIKEQLIQYFKPHNEKLSQYVGMSFNWDRQ